MIIYIAGKITNDPGYKEKFRQAERHKSRVTGSVHNKYGAAESWRDAEQRK